jgi:hypothetical protein
MFFLDNDASYILSQGLEMVLEITDAVYSAIEIGVTSPDETSEASDIVHGYGTRLGFGEKKGRELSDFIDKLNIAAFCTDNSIILLVADGLTALIANAKSGAEACFDSRGSVIIKGSNYKGLVLNESANNITPTPTVVEVTQAVKSAASIFKAITELGMNIGRMIADADPPLQASTPTATPPAGKVASGTRISLTCATSGATIKYTTDGTDPLFSATKHTGASPISITVTASMTIRAIATKDGWTNSGVLTAQYTV